MFAFSASLTTNNFPASNLTLLSPLSGPILVEIAVPLYVNTNSPDRTNFFTLLDYEVYTHNE